MRVCVCVYLLVKTNRPNDTNSHVCCYFNISITIQSVKLEESPTQLQSAAALSDDLTKYTAGHSKIGKAEVVHITISYLIITDVFRAPVVVSFYGEECHNLTTCMQAIFLHNSHVHTALVLIQILPSQNGV